jgi:hypothetical protein
MTFASGMQRDIAIVDEVTFGSTPATPSFKLVRVLEGSGMNPTKVAEVIRQLTAHSNPVDLVQLGQDAAGKYELVPSYGDAFESFLLAAIRQSAFTANVAWNGRVAAVSKTIEEKITGTALNYLRFTGAEVEQLDLSVAAREVMKASVSLQAKDAVIATTAISGATYAAVNAEEVYTGIQVAGLALMSLSPVPSVRAIQMSVRHALTAINTVGNLNRSGTSFDQIEVTGSVETLFEDKTAYDKFLNHSSGALAFTIGTVTAKKYTFTLPKVYFSEGTFSQAGTGPVSATLGFQAVYDGTNGTIKIEKAVA